MTLRSVRLLSLGAFALGFTSLLATSLAAQQAKVLAPHKDIAPRVEKRIPWPSPTQRSMVGGLWMIDANFKSALYLKNVVETDPITVTPILWLSNGTRYALPNVTLEPAGTAVIDINAGLQQKGISPWATLSGYVELQYSWPWDPICATIRDTDTAHSLIFTYGLRSPAIGQDQDPTAATQATYVVEGMWWKQESNVTGFVALANVSSQPTRATVVVSDSQGKAVMQHTVTVSPHGTKLVKLNELQQTPGTIGGLRVTYTAASNALVINGGLEDQGVGYSAGLPFTLGSAISLPVGGHTVNPTGVAEIGLMTGAADPMMLFPAGTTFTPYSVLRNVSGAPVSVTPVLWWMEGGAARSARAPQISLLPYQAQSLDVKSLLSLAGLKDFNGSFNVVLDGEIQPDALLLASGSVDQTNTYVFESAPRGIAESASKTFQYWSTGNGDDTMVTLWNPADEAQDFMFKLAFSGGHYALPIHLEARATRAFNISEVIENQVPDAEGNTIPASVHEGSGTIAGSQADNEAILVAIAVGIYNVRKATCSGTNCITCDGYTTSGSAIVASPYAVPVGGQNQLAWTLTFNNGAQYNYTGASGTTWNSGNTSVATVNTGLVKGVKPGSATMSATSTTAPIYVPQMCNTVNVCPTGGGASSNGSVKPTISGPTTLWWFNGLSLGVNGYASQVTLTASSESGTAYQWTIASGSDKISLSGSGQTSTATFTSTGQSKTLNDVTVTVTVAGQTSAPFGLTVRAPYMLGPDPSHPTPVYLSDPTYVWQTDVYYQVLDNLLTPMPVVLPINEYFTTGIVPEYSGTNWNRGPAGCANLNADATFADGIYGQQPNYYPTPVYNPNWTGAKVIIWGQDWHLGTCVNGSGPRVQSDNIQKWTDHALHVNIVSPAP